MLTRIISGGQTGVDQAALRAAASLGVAIGGWCPPGRVAEDGLIPDRFPLIETPEDRSPDALDIPRSQRTQWNVRDSDGTLLLCRGELEAQGPGTRWTAACAQQRGKPLFIADPAALADVPRAHCWLDSRGIHTLNVAGPSESSSPGIGAAAERFVAVLLRLDALYGHES
jgi:Circularly permutated YpsA SLOG family